MLIIGSVSWIRATALISHGGSKMKARMTVEELEKTEKFLKQKAKAEAGYVDDCRAVAVQYSLAGDPARMEHYYKMGMDFGDLNSQCSLGEFYLRSKSLNVPLALQLLSDAAEKGHLEALVMLGEQYITGRHVRRDLNRAFAYVKKYAEDVMHAADIGIQDNLIAIGGACTHYPICLALGIGCQRNPQEAYKVLDRMAKKGFTAAEELRDERKIHFMIAAEVYEALSPRDIDNGCAIYPDVQSMLTDVTKNWNVVSFAGRG